MARGAGPAVSDRILLTPLEAAEALGISERMLRELTHAGDVPAVRLAARIVRYSARALDTWAVSRSEAESHGRKAKVGNRELLSAPWGQKVVRVRPRTRRTPDPVRLDTRRGQGDAG